MRRGLGCVGRDVWLHVITSRVAGGGWLVVGCDAHQSPLLRQRGSAVGAERTRGAERDGRDGGEPPVSLTSLYGTVFGDVTVTSEFAPPLPVSCDARRPCDSRVWGLELRGACGREGM